MADPEKVDLPFNSHRRTRRTPRFPISGTKRERPPKTAWSMARDSGEVMELGYDDSNPPTDGGGDRITE